MIAPEDLAILNSIEDRYERYVAGIRKEYAWVPEVEYCKGRANVLEHFLARPKLYWTEAMREECGDQARANLRGELQQLSNAHP